MPFGGGVILDVIAKTAMNCATEWIPLDGIQVDVESEMCADRDAFTQAVLSLHRKGFLEYRGPSRDSMEIQIHLGDACVALTHWREARYTKTLSEQAQKSARHSAWAALVCATVSVLSLLFSLWLHYSNPTPPHDHPPAPEATAGGTDTGMGAPQNP